MRGGELIIQTYMEMGRRVSTNKGRLDKRTTLRKSMEHRREDNTRGKSINLKCLSARKTFSVTQLVEVQYFS
jgi:hypothetical protein